VTALKNGEVWIDVGRKDLREAFSKARAALGSYLPGQTFRTQHHNGVLAEALERGVIGILKSMLQFSRHPKLQRCKIKSASSNVCHGHHVHGFGSGSYRHNCCSCYNLGFVFFCRLHCDLGYLCVLLVFWVVIESVKK
jgi:hypothetical protein